MNDSQFVGIAISEHDEFPTFFSSIKRILLGFNESNFHARNFPIPSIITNLETGRDSRRDFSRQERLIPLARIFSFFSDCCWSFCSKLGTDGKVGRLVGLGMIIDSKRRGGFIDLALLCIVDCFDEMKVWSGKRSKWMCEYCKRNFVILKRVLILINQLDCCLANIQSHTHVRTYIGI